MVSAHFLATKPNERKEISIYGQLNKTDVKRTVGCEGDLKDTCETCAMGKHASQPVPKKVEDKAKKALELQSVTLKLGTLTSKRHFLIYLWKIHL